MPSVPGNRNFKTRTDVERDSEWEDAPGAKKKKTNEGKTLQYIGIAPDVSKKNAIVEGGSSLLDKSVSEQDKIVDCETSSNIQLQLVLKIKRSEEGTSLKVVERKRKPLQKADEKVSHDQSKTEEKNKNGIKVESVSNEVLDVSNKTKNVTFHSGIENTAYKQRNIKLPEDVPQTGLPDEKDKFPVPSWAVKPPDGAHLDVYMGTALIQKLMIDDKKAYYFGRNNKQVDIVVEHATCSRVHSLFLYSGLLKRFALVDLESSHGTFIGNVRLRPLEVVFIDIGSQFQLGASTRKYAVRLKVEQHVEEDPTVSTSDYQLDEIEKDKEPMLFSFNNIMSNTTKGDIKSGRKLRSEEDPQKDSVDLKNSLFSDEESGPEYPSFGLSMEKPPVYHEVPEAHIKLSEDVPQIGLPDERDKFPVPSWAVKPPDGAHLDVYMGTALIQKLMIDDKKAYYFGRNNKQVDIVVEHATCSRVHSLFLYCGLLKRFALVDLESSHGTFIGNVRLRPLEVVFIDIGSQFQLGASTRKYAVRLKVEQHVEEDPTVSTSDYQLDEIEKDKEPMLFSFNNIMSNTTKGDIKSGRKLRSEEDPQKDSVDLKNSLFSDEEAGPEQHVEEDPTVLASDYQLDHLTEYNTAQNRRIPQLPISLEEARRKKRKRGNIAFIDEEEVINPEDVDPSVGRFQNRVTTEIISTNSGKRAGADIKGHTPRKIVRPSREVLTAPLSSTLGSLSLNAAPTLPEKEKLEGHHKKKYAKEAWPGKKPVFYFF